MTQSTDQSEALAYEAMTTPSAPGDRPLPRRNGPKPLIPASWTGRTVQLAITNSAGREVPIEGKLLDTFPFGVCMCANGSGGNRTLYAWDSIRSIELLG